MRSAQTGDVAGALDLDLLRSILHEHPVRIAILFGSRADGTVHAASDVDVAVEFESHRPGDPDYNDVFLGLSADLSDALETDAVDLVDVRTASGPLRRSILDRGRLLVGDPERAAELRAELAVSDESSRSPRERFDAALAKIDAHLNESGETAPAAGGSDRDR